MADLAPPIDPSPAPASERGFGAPITAIFAMLLMVIAIGGAVWLKMNDVVMVLAGTIGSGFMTVLNYYFGSSRGSQSKDDTIAKQLPK